MKMQIVFRPWAAIVSVVALTGLISGCVPAMEGEETTRVPPAQRVDPPATPITAPSIDAEQTLSTEDYAGQVVLLDFWAPWSEQSVEELAQMADLQREFGEHGFTVVGMVIERGEPDEIRAKLEGREFAYPVMIASAEMLRPYGSRAIPTRVLLDASGEVAGTFPGSVSFDELRQEIKQLLDGLQP